MKFDQHLNGMVELRLPAVCTEEILQQITASGIFVYQVRRRDDYLYLIIHLDDFSAVQHLLRERGCRFHVQKRHGIPFVFNRLKRRKGLWLGLGTGFAVLYLLLSFLWGYEVSGNVYYSQEHLIALVQEYGMVPGSSIDKFDYDALSRQIVQEHPEFTWFHLEPGGTTLHITVKERLADTGGIHKTGSLVARNDGRITELLVFRGTPLVQKGDWVTKGQVLVGGWDYPDRQRQDSGLFGPVGEPFAVEAQAVIYGEQERRAIGSCALEEQTLTATGREQKQVALLWGSHQIIIRGPAVSPYRYSSQIIEQHNLFSWKGFQFPVLLKTTVFQEKEIQTTTYTAAEAYDCAVKRARKRLQEQMPSGSRFIHESIGMYAGENQNVVQAEVVWLVEENIARMAQEPLPPEIQAEMETEEEKTEETEQNLQAAGT